MRRAPDSRYTAPMTPPTGARPAWRWMTRAPRTPETQLRRQERRAAALLMLLTVVTISTSVLLLGGLGSWVMLALVNRAGTDPNAAAFAETARTLVPYVRLISAYSVLVLLLTWGTRQAVIERRRYALSLAGTLTAALLLAFPLGTLVGVALACFLPPKRWLDQRPAARP